jgi:hypothetical protein
MPREMLKLRKGDSAIMIKSDGSVEMAGVNDKPLVSDEGMILPVILFAAAWAKKDPKVLETLVTNFKDCVREGYFGPDAQEDFKQMEIEGEKKKQRAASAAVTLSEKNMKEQIDVLNASDATTQAEAQEVLKEYKEKKAKGPKIEPNVSPEEFAIHKEEEKRLEAIAAQGQDPQVLRQMEALKAGAKSITEKPFEGHLMSDEEKEQFVGNITIDEENKDNEDQ